MLGYVVCSVIWCVRVLGVLVYTVFRLCSMLGSMVVTWYVRVLGALGYLVC
jgi:hypothetical protein